MLGIKWSHKLNLWVVYDKATDKIFVCCETEKEAKRAFSKLRSLPLSQLRKRLY